MLGEWNGMKVLVKYPKKPLEDCPGNELCLFVVSERFKNCLQDKVKECAEFLPLVVIGGHQFYLFHVYKFVDCIDHDAPTHPAGKVFGDFIFDTRKIPSDPCFRVPDNPIFTIVRPEFIEIVNKFRITGLTFDDCRWEKRELL